MNANKFAVGLCGLAIWTSAPAYSQQATIAPNDDPKRVLVGRLDLERYKATLRGLGQYGDRQQGTDRNRAAVDWIEAQLRSYGCAPERIKYVYNSPGLSRDQQIVAHPPGTPVGSGEIVMGLGGARIRGMTLPVVPNNNPAAQTDPILRALNEAHWDRNRARPAVGEGFPFLLFRLQDGFTVPPWLTFPEAPL